MLEQLHSSTIITNINISKTYYLPLNGLIPIAAFAVTETSTSK